MKCYLHIGTDKTATKTLQNFLKLNRDKLSTLGFLYTKSAGYINNRKLPVAAYNRQRRDDFTRSNGIVTDETLKSYQQKIVSDLTDEISANPSLNVVFSSEHIQSRLTDPSELQRLKEILVDLGFDNISVIVYLRSPPVLANSLYSTAVKSGSTASCPPSPKKSNYYRTICHHENTLKRFGAVFGDGSLVPRIFEVDEFKNGSIIEDFMDAIGAPWCEDYELPGSVNESLSAIGIEILRRVNKRIPKFIDNKPNELRGDLVGYFESYFGGDKYVMPQQLYEEYEAEFESSNEWVRKNWFPSRPTLFRQKDYPGESEVQLPAIELDRLANLIADIWIAEQ